MKHKINKVVVLVFCLFLGGISLLGIVSSDRKFSEMENRNLQQFPKFTVSKVQSGRYMKEMEDYVSDQTILRDQWVGLKAFLEKIIGKKENNHVYFGDDDTLIKKVEVVDENKVIKNAEYVRELTEELTIPVYYGLIPSAAEIWQEKLPEGAVTANESEWIEKIYKEAKLQGIDFVEPLSIHKDEPIYYKTDHHWTSLGAFYGANSILESMNKEQLNLDGYEKKVVSSEFYGTSYSVSGAWWTSPDEISIYVPNDGVEVMSNFTGEEEAGNLYNYEKLQNKNKYEFFLGGNQPLCVVKSQNKGEKILIVRDSYSDCLVPFLSERFEEIHLFDLRYNQLSIKKYIEENKIDQLLILYSFPNYIEDENQFLLIH